MEKKYEYYPKVSITLGGIEHLPGSGLPLPEGRDYEPLVELGMVTKVEVKGEFIINSLKEKTPMIKVKRNAKKRKH
jgi:hypothetical protein